MKCRFDDVVQTSEKKVTLENKKLNNGKKKAMAVATISKETKTNFMKPKSEKDIDKNLLVAAPVKKKRLVRQKPKKSSSLEEIAKSEEKKHQVALNICFVI